MTQGTTTPDEGELEEAVSSMDTARYAEILAHLNHFSSAPSADVLRRFGVDAGEWARVSEDFQRAFSAAAREHRLDGLRRFAAATERVRARLQSERPRLADIGDAEEPPAPRPPAPRGALVETSLDLHLGALPPALPFVAASAAVARTPAQESAAHALPPRPAAIPTAPRARGPETTPDRGVLRSATAPLDELPAAPALPFANAGASPEGPPTIGASPLAQYAAVCVELSLDPDRAPEILGRHGLDAERKERLDELWRQRFADDPALLRAWERAAAAVESWLRRSAGRPPR